MFDLIDVISIVQLNFRVLLPFIHVILHIKLKAQRRKGNKKNIFKS